MRVFQLNQEKILESDFFNPVVYDFYMYVYLLYMSITPSYFEESVKNSLEL